MKFEGCRMRVQAAGIGVTCEHMQGDCSHVRESQEEPTVFASGGGVTAKHI